MFLNVSYINSRLYFKPVRAYRSLTVRRREPLGPREPSRSGGQACQPVRSKEGAGSCCSFPHVDIRRGTPSRSVYYATQSPSGQTTLSEIGNDWSHQG